MKEFLRNLTLRLPEIYSYLPTFGIKYGQLHRTISTVSCRLISQDTTMLQDNTIIPGLIADKELIRTQSLKYFKEILLKEPCVNTIDGAFYAGGMCTDNFYHMLIEILPLILTYQTSNNQPIIVNQKFQLYHLFEAFGISSKRILKSSNNTYYTNLKVVPILTISLHDKLFILKESYKLPIEYKYYPKKLYISRADASRRKVVNEQDVINLLVKNKFFCGVLSDLSFQEQINFFHAAEVIVLPHGAASANLFMAKNCKKVIEFLPSIGGGYTTMLLCQTLGIEYVPVECRNHFSNMKVELEILERNL